MSESKALVAPAAGRIAVREDVDFVVQTKAQRRWVLGLMLGGVASVVSLTGGGQGVMPMVFGAIIGGASTKIRTMGRGRLLRWVKQLDVPSQRARALALLEGMAMRAPLITTSVRMEAAGHAALARVESGEFEAALNILASSYRDLGKRQRQRLPDQGFLGEAVHALLARLAPASTTEVVPAARIVSEQVSVTAAHPDFHLAIALLRVLEAMAVGGQATALTAWREANQAPRAPAHPVLMALVGAALHAGVELEEQLEDQLLARLEALSEHTRASITAWYPRVSELGRQGYRAPGRVSEATRAMVPAGLQGLVPGRAPSRWVPAVGRRTRVVMGITTALFGFNALISLVAGDPVGLFASGLVVLLFSPTLVSTPILRRRRAALLEREGLLQGDEDPRRAELLAMPARSGPARGEAANLHPLDLTELRLLVGLQRAQEAVVAGELQAARTWVRWWMDTAVEQGFGDISPLALGSAALRVAVLVELPLAAEAIERALAGPKRDDPRVPRPPRVRSGYGDAPQAVALARALRRLVAGDHEAAAKILELAAHDPAVVCDPFERLLYGHLVAALNDRGHELGHWRAAFGEQYRVERAPSWFPVR